MDLLWRDRLHVQEWSANVSFVSRSTKTFSDFELLYPLPPLSDRNTGEGFFCGFPNCTAHFLS